MPPLLLRFEEPGRVGQDGGADHLVIGQERLHQQPPATLAGPEQPGGAHQQGHRLLGRPVPRGVQLVVDVEECHHVGVRDAVQHRFGADVDLGVGGRRVVAARHGHTRPSGGRLQLLAQAGDPGRRLANAVRPHT